MPESFSTPRDANGATANTLVALALTPLAQTQEDRRRLLFGLEPDQQDGPGLLEIAERRTEAGAGHRGGQEVGLLGGVRQGPEVDVVGAEGDPGELRVRVGVLERSAGHPVSTAALPRAAVSFFAAKSSASGHEAARSSPSLADHRVGQPV